MSTSGKEQQRGPVEEIIAKRLRPLNKKAQRVRTYAAQDHASLNADQKSALANLPVLEGSIRELEELLRQVDEAELIAAARERELREAAEREFEARVAARIAEAQLSLASRLGHFLSLHSLLHPARPNDVENLTFAPLDLPPRMADEVLATDILRVGRMYDDILAGGDAAGAILTGLASGPSDEDEEDARVHNLIVLLSQPEVEVPETPAEPEEEPEDPAVTVTFEQPAGLGRTALNFLQEDELAQPEVVADFVVVEPISVPPSVPATSEPTGFDWTAADDDENTAQRLHEAFSTPQADTPEAGDAEVDEAAEGIEAVHVSGTATPASDGQRKRAPRKRKPHGKKPEGEAASGSEEKKPQQQQPKKKAEGQNGGQRRPRQNQPKKEKPEAAGPDEDGFQVQKPKARAAKPATRGRGGRPNAGGDRANNGAKRDGAGKENGGKPRQPKEQKEAQPKPSIYKQTQPSGPSSAPIF